MKIEISDLEKGLASRGYSSGTSLNVEVSVLKENYHSDGIGPKGQRIHPEFAEKAASFILSVLAVRLLPGFDERATEAFNRFVKEVKKMHVVEESK